MSSVTLSSVNVLFCPLQNKTLPLENTTDCLSTMASVCKVMLETPWVTDGITLTILAAFRSHHHTLRFHFKPNASPVVSLSVFVREYSSRFSSEDTVLFCMRVMVGVIILYDHVHPNGAFNKSSKIDVGRTPERSHQRHCRWATLWHGLFVSPSSDERLHKSPEGPAGGQSRRSPQRPQVGCVYSAVDGVGVLLCWFVADVFSSCCTVICCSMRVAPLSFFFSFSFSQFTLYLAFCLFTVPLLCVKQGWPSNSGLSGIYGNNDIIIFASSLNPNPLFTLSRISLYSVSKEIVFVF